LRENSLKINLTNLEKDRSAGHSISEAGSFGGTRYTTAAKSNIILKKFKVPMLLIFIS